jgi:hypothetical protein
VLVGPSYYVVGEAIQTIAAPAHQAVQRSDP